MRFRSLLASMIIVASVAPLWSAAAAPAGCTVHSYEAIPLGFGIYMVGTAAEFWQESNGEPGLQRTQSFCSGGRTIPADTCIVHSETFVALNCAAEFVS